MFLVAVLLSAHINFLVADPLVTLPNGQIRGREATTLEDKTMYAFEGIPYAAPPVGDLRFRPPQPAESWDDVLDTVKISNMCYQTSSNSDTESEDCLYLNVYTPQLPSEDNEELLPVMFYIYGGGFVEGSSDFFTGDLYVNNDVVMVSFNYRVGIFGFISTQDEVIPGNYGLKDQVFALQWVYDHISLFGGDPEQITLFGQSAGSASCAYQLLNPNSQGLIKGVILESGSFLSPWAYQRDARKFNFATAALLNSTFETNGDSQALLDFLLTVDAKDLDGAAEEFRNNLWQTGPANFEIAQGYYWAPVIEPEGVEDAFITEKMYGLLKEGKILPVPTLIGMTSEESLRFYADPDFFQQILTIYDQDPGIMVPHDMRIEDQVKLVQMGLIIREMYTQGERWDANPGQGIKFSSDTSFSRSLMKHAELNSKLAPTYFYVFSYDGPKGNLDVNYEGADTVGHGEEVVYVFCGGPYCDMSEYPEADLLTRQRLIKIFTDFAKYQNPTPEPSELLQNITWPALSTEDGDFYYVDIGENLEVKNNPRDTYQTWSYIYDNLLDYHDFDTY